MNKKRLHSSTVRYLFGDNFTDTLPAGSIHGTPAVPGPGTRVVVDANNKLTLASGLLNIAAGRSSVSTAVPALRAARPVSTVLATLQTNRAGVYIQAAVANPRTGRITIYLNRRVTAATKVAYFVLD